MIRLSKLFDFKLVSHNSHSYLIIFYFLISQIIKIWQYEIKLPLQTVLASVVLIILLYYSLQLILARIIESKIYRQLIISCILWFVLFYQTWSYMFSNIYLMRKITEELNINHRIIDIVILLFIFLLLVYTINKFKSLQRVISNYLNLLLITLMIYKAFEVINYEPNNIQLENRFNTSINFSANLERPDIYYIILDSYTSNASLKRYWDFDNLEFTNFLKERGFYFSEGSKSNYNYTPSSLSSSLNSSYLNVKNKAIYSLTDRNRLDSLIRTNQVFQLLKKNGYKKRIYSIFNIDQSIPEIFGINNKTTTVINTTIISTIMRGIKKRNETKDQQLYLKGCFEYNKNSFDFLDSIGNLARNSNPHFTLVHSLTTHAPFVVDEDGSFSQEQSLNPNINKMKYINGVKYTNKRLRSFIISILSKSGPKPIIILQGDHGSHLIDIKETSTILNAYYFPDKDYSSLYQNISPINTFRVIFNKYFNTNLPLLRDENFHISYGYV